VGGVGSTDAHLGLCESEEQDVSGGVVWLGRRR
jgi:hypothetical protein